MRCNRCIFICTLLASRTRTWSNAYSARFEGQRHTTSPLQLHHLLTLSSTQMQIGQAAQTHDVPHLDIVSSSAGHSFHGRPSVNLPCRAPMPRLDTAQLPTRLQIAVGFDLFFMSFILASTRPRSSIVITSPLCISQRTPFTIAG